MDEFIEFTASIDLIVTDVIIGGTIQRVTIEDGKEGNKDGAHCLYHNIICNHLYFQ